MGKNYNNCNLQMPAAYNKMLKLNQGQKFLKILFIFALGIFARKNTHMDSNPEESFISKTNKHTVSGYLYLHSIYILSTEVTFYEDLFFKI